MTICHLVKCWLLLVTRWTFTICSYKIFETQSFYWMIVMIRYDVIKICKSREIYFICFMMWFVFVCYVSLVENSFLSRELKIGFFPWNVTPLTTDRHFLLIGWIQFEMELLHLEVCYSHDVHIVFHIIINRFIKFYWLSSMIRSWKTISYLYTCHRIASQCWHFHYQL